MQLRPQKSASFVSGLYYTHEELMIKNSMAQRLTNHGAGAKVVTSGRDSR